MNNNSEIVYKIEANKKYTIYKNIYNDVPYYKILVYQKMYDGTKKSYYKEVKFKRGIELENTTTIIIKKAFENLRDNPKDSIHPISYLMITEFEIASEKEKSVAEAYEDFRKNLDENNGIKSDTTNETLDVYKEFGDSITNTDDVSDLLENELPF